MRRGYLKNVAGYLDVKQEVDVTGKNKIEKKDKKVLRGISAERDLLSSFSYARLCVWVLLPQPLAKSFNGVFFAFTGFFDFNTL